MSSSRVANAPGVYSSPDDAPHAPSASACSTSCVMRAISSAVAGRFTLPMTMPRMVPRPTIVATLTLGGSDASDCQNALKFGKACRPLSSSGALPIGARDEPSWPTTIVVTPCLTIDSERGSSQSDPSPCEWMSMNPGATAIPRASISTAPSSLRFWPIATMRPASIPRSDSIPWVPSPSKTVPPRVTRAYRRRQGSTSRGEPTRAASVVPARRTNERRERVIGRAVLSRQVHDPRRSLSFRENIELRPRLRSALLAERFSHECGPPVTLLVECSILLERGPRLLVDFLGALARLVARDVLAFEHPPADLRVEDLVGPIVVVEVR